MQKRIVMTGANGQLGQTLARSTLAETQLLLPLSREDLDITDGAAVVAALDSLRPDFIINAAAYTAVDAAESHREQAFNINALGVRHLADWAATSGAHLIHVSTDFVFGGDGNRPYRPDDPGAPLGVYGQSKLAGEQVLAELLPGRATLVRTAWLYSPYCNNFVKTMLRLMRERDTLNVVDDQIGTPCSTATLVQCLQAIVVRNCPGSVYHCTDAGVASWYDFAVAIQEEALALELLDQAIPIRPIPTERFPTAARRPAFSVLDKSTTVEELGLVQVHWRAALRDVLKQINER